MGIITSIVIFLNICGKSPGINYNKFKSMWYTSASADGQDTMEGYYNSCSQGSTLFPENGNYIVPNEVIVPCEGNLSGHQWGSPPLQCRFYELYGWATFANDYLTNVANIKMDNYSRKIYVLPYNSKCAWIGSSIRMNIWINGPHALTLPTLFHELGHTLGLMHSSTPLGEYGDYSCAMGGDAGVRCFNAPQNWVLGWAKPIADLNFTNTTNNFRNNTWYSYTIPPQTSVENNMIRINYYFNNNYYFISFRANINYDKGLYSIYTNAVSIHNYNNNHTYNISNTNNDYNRLYMGRPKLLKVMRVVGQVWIEPTEQLAIRIDSIENEYSAGVSVCHYNNNLNNISDCN